MVSDVVRGHDTPPARAIAAPNGARRVVGARAASVVAVLLGAAFFALTTWMATARHDTFNTGRFDLEIYTQVVWNTAQGNPFATTLLKMNLSHLAEHVALILIPIAGLYRLFPDPKLLLALQQGALALLGLPLFLFARRALGSPWQAVLVLACFYLTPALAGVALDDFHAVPMATLPIAAGLWFVLTGRSRVGAGLSLLALPLEEETALVVIGIGALLWLRQQRGLGLLVGALAAAYLAVVVLVIMPTFHDPRTLSGVDGNRTLNHFQEIRDVPAKIPQRLVGERGRDALVWLALPTASLGVLAPQALLTGLPSLAALLLQDRDDTFGRHWVTPLLVAIWFATVLGLAWLRPGLMRRLGLLVLVVGTVISYRLVSPLPGGGTFNDGALWPDDHTALLRRAVELPPPDAVVVASPNLVAHLANRPEAYVFPIDSHYAEELGWRRKRPDYYVLDLVDELTSRATISDRLNPLNADKPFTVWSNGHKVLALSDAEPTPTHTLDVQYDSRLRLRGYDLERVPEGIRLALYWERYGDVRGRYDREMTVLNPAGETVYYEGDMALSLVYGSNKWRLGQTVVDEVVIPPADGPLRVRIGWVAQDKRKPFRLDDGSDAFELTIDTGG
ncbi:MAG: DUF2079 domain-containing protein [Chloroflexi bacterium]|nr:DUF2079 domain-containing protein [Chloroflexota bacterium]